MSFNKEFIDSVKITPLLDTLRLEKIDDEIYFSEKYSNYISNSRLSFINPKQDNNPDAFFGVMPKQYSDALIFGSVVHELTLQSDLFFLCDSIDRPTAKAGFMADELYNQYKGHVPCKDDIIIASDKIDYYKGKMNQNRIDELIEKCKMYWAKRNTFERNYSGNQTPIYLDAKSRERVNECLNAISNNSNIQNLLHPVGIITNPISENEQAILLDIQIDIPGHDAFVLKLKSKLDNYTIDFENNEIIVNDIKTIGKILPEFENNITRYHYSREIAMYSWLLSLCAKKHYDINNPTIKGNYLVVSTIPQYYTTVRPVKAKEFKSGFNEFVNLIKLVCYYMVEKGYKWT